MNEQKSLAALKTKSWYRLLKVIYIILFGILSVAILMGICFGYQSKTLVDHERTMIVCNYGEKTTFSLKEAGIYLTKEDFDDWNKWSDNYRNLIQIKAGYVSKYRSDEIKEKREQVEQACNFTEKQKQAMFAAAREELKNPDLPKSKYIYDLNPVYKTVGGWPTIIGYWVLAILGLAIAFELPRRIFYYIILGEFVPKK